MSLGDMATVMGAVGIGGMALAVVVSAVENRRRDPDDSDGPPGYGSVALPDED